MNKFDITLMDGRVVSAGYLRFDWNTYHIWWEDEDVTSLITRSDKLTNWPGFSASRENTRIYTEDYVSKHGGQAPPPDDTRTVNQIFLDELGGRLQSGVGYVASGVGTGIKDTVQTAIIFGIAGLVAYMLLKGK